MVNAQALQITDAGPSCARFGMPGWYQDFRGLYQQGCEEATARGQPQEVRRTHREVGSVQVNPGPHFSGASLNCFILSDLREATIKLRTKLGPSSPFHDNRSAPALRDAVLEVEELIERLSEFPGNAAAKTKEGIKEDWRLGRDGIVVDVVRARKGRKPEVVLDEEDLLYPY